MAVQLTILRGPNSGRTYQFEDNVISIGSGRNNTLVIRDNDVSTQHCQLIRLQQDYDIEDLGSRYGTFVNGQKLTNDKWLLKSGAIIELGSQITLEYRQLDPEGSGNSRPIFMREGDPGSQPVLVLVNEALIKEAYLLQSEEITLGRSVGNDIVVTASDISRTHARLRWADDHYEIEDMKSRNGTFVNGVALEEGTKTLLEHSDVIRLGALTKFHFVYRADLPEEWDPIHPDDAEKQRTTQEVTMPFMTAARREGTRELGANVSEGDLIDHILITYAREDWEDIVAPIVLNLEDAKQKVWVDQHLRPGSEPWVGAMEHAQTECWLLVVVVSPDAMRTAYVKDLYRYFYNREKPIILVDYKTVTRLPFQLAQMPRIIYDRESPGKMFRRLLLEIIQLKPRYVDEEHATDLPTDDD
jgi:pSer/pThr/pTyr-binding forkhead associated (FHA) protein